MDNNLSWGTMFEPVNKHFRGHTELGMVLRTGTKLKNLSHCGVYEVADFKALCGASSYKLATVTAEYPGDEAVLILPPCPECSAVYAREHAPAFEMQGALE